MPSGEGASAAPIRVCGYRHEGELLASVARGGIGCRAQGRGWDGSSASGPMAPYRRGPQKGSLLPCARAHRPANTANDPLGLVLATDGLSRRGLRPGTVRRDARRRHPGHRAVIVAYVAERALRPTSRDRTSASGRSNLRRRRRPPGGGVVSRQPAGAVVAVVVVSSCSNAASSIASQVLATSSSAAIPVWRPARAASGFGGGLSKGSGGAGALGCGHAEQGAGERRGEESSAGGQGSSLDRGRGRSGTEGCTARWRSRGRTSGASPGGSVVRFVQPSKGYAPWTWTHGSAGQEGWLDKVWTVGRHAAWGSASGAPASTYLCAWPRPMLTSAPPLTSTFTAV